MAVIKSAITVLLLGLCSCTAGRRVAADYGEANDRPTAPARNDQDASIVNQIHRHDPDGSYTYGFEGSDGSFKVETKTRTGAVSGKYGYVDDTGKLRVVEYGADELGFRASGEGETAPAAAGPSREQDDAPGRPGPADGPSAGRTPQRPAAAFRDHPRRPPASAPLSDPPELRSAAAARSLSGSYRTVQEFGDRASAGHAYRTVEDYQEPQTEQPAFYRPTAGSRRRTSAAARRRSRTGGVLDRSPLPADSA